MNDRSTFPTLAGHWYLDWALEETKKKKKKKSLIWPGGGAVLS